MLNIERWFIHPEDKLESGTVIRNRKDQLDSYKRRLNGYIDVNKHGTRYLENRPRNTWINNTHWGM